MPDVLDPEPTDKRTNDWKAWKVRQTPAVPEPEIMDLSPSERIVFGATFLAGCQAFGVSSARFDQMKEAYYDLCRFNAWVATGEAKAGWTRKQEIEASLERRKREIAEADAAAEKAKREAAEAEMGAKATVR